MKDSLVPILKLMDLYVKKETEGKNISDENFEFLIKLLKNLMTKKNHCDKVSESIGLIFKQLRNYDLSL